MNVRQAFVLMVLVAVVVMQIVQMGSALKVSVLVAVVANSVRPVFVMSLCAKVVAVVTNVRLDAVKLETVFVIMMANVLMGFVWIIVALTI
jgi:hypothetical protein